MPSIISYIGVIGSGKDYNTDMRVDRDGYVRVDFKDELLNLASDIAGYDVRKDYEWFKKAIVGVKRPANKFMELYLMTDMLTIIAQHPDTMTGRRLLTRLGTEGMRKRDPEYWVKYFIKAARAHLGNGKSVSNADCRFLNEVSAVKKIGVESKFVFCDYHSERYDPTFPHESERMAQVLLKIGLKDGQEITDDHFAVAAQVLNEVE